MRDVRAWFAALGLLGMLASPGPARGQAVGFSPQVGVLPEGVALNATPVVSADRRYVRLSLGVGFATIDGFQTFPVPAAVGGGGAGGGAGGGGFAVVTGMNGPIGPGMPGPSAGPDPSMGVGPGSGGPGVGVAPQGDPGDWWTRNRRPRPTRSRPARAKQAAPVPATSPAKKKP